MPTGTFEISPGRTVEFRGTTTRSDGLRAGDRVALVYDPEDPSHSAFPYEVEEPVGSLFLAVSGLIGTGLGIFLVRRRLRGDDDPWR